MSTITKFHYKLNTRVFFGFVIWKRPKGNSIEIDDRSTHCESRFQFFLQPVCFPFSFENNAVPRRRRRLYWLYRLNKPNFFPLFFTRFCRNRIIIMNVHRARDTMRVKNFVYKFKTYIMRVIIITSRYTYNYTMAYVPFQWNVRVV